MNLSAMLSGHGLAVSASILAGLIVAVSAWRMRRTPVSRRLLLLSLAVTTGLSADSMWQVSGRVLHLDGPIRAALFAFGELALLAAVAMTNEALRDLRRLAVAEPDETTTAEMIESQVVAARRRARGFTAAVWVIAAGVGYAATTASTSTAEASIRITPPILVALFWWAGLDRSGMAATRESITSRLGVRRILVRLGLADPGKTSLADVDRQRRLYHLAGRIYAYHQTKTGTRARSIADWRLARADRAARRYLDDAGRQYITDQLAARYKLRSSTSPDALSGIDPWQTSGQAIADRPADSGADSVIDGEVLSVQVGSDTEADTYPDSSADSAPDSRAPVRRTPRRTVPTIVPLAVHRAAGQVSVETMADWIDGQFPDRVPGRPTVQAALRGQFGSCSTGRAIEVRDILAERRRAS